MSNLDDTILELWHNGADFAKNGRPGSGAKAAKNAKQQIKDMMLELIGPDEYEEGMVGDDKLMTKHADFYRDELRQKVNEL